MTAHADYATATDDQTAPIVQALQRVTDAIAQLFGPFISGQLAIECMRRSVVKQAWEQMHRTEPEAAGLRKTSYTRLALATGMDTRQVRKLLSEPLRAGQEHICVEAAILNAWAKDPSLRNRYDQQPAELPIFGQSGTFEGLVGRYAGRGVSVRYVLERLEKHGNVKTVNKHFVRLVDPVWALFVNQEDLFLKETVGSIVNLAKAIKHNLEHITDPDKKWTERYAFSYFVPEEKRLELERHLSRHLIDSWLEARNIIKAYESTDGKDMTPMPVLGVGFYFWDDERHYQGQDAPCPIDGIGRLSTNGPYRNQSS